MEGVMRSHDVNRLNQLRFLQVSAGLASASALDRSRIFAGDEKKWRIVEQEKEGLTPLESVQISYTNLMKLL